MAARNVQNREFRTTMPERRLRCARVGDRPVTEDIKGIRNTYDVTTTSQSLLRMTSLQSVARVSLSPLRQTQRSEGHQRANS